MAYCSNCGAMAQDGAKFCPSCGTGMAQPQAQAYQQPPAQAYQPPPYQQQRAYQAPVVPGAPAQADIRDAQDNKAMAILAYILFFVPLLTGAHKTSAFARYHTNQGTVLFLFTLAWGIVYAILTAILTAILFNPSALLGGGWGALGILTTVLGLLWLIPTILCVVGIIHAAQGRMQPLPLIGRINIIK